MKKDTIKTLIVIGVIWLVILGAVFLIKDIFSCPSACLPDKISGEFKCGCDLQAGLITDDLLIILVLGIPSWILFLIAALSRGKKK